MKKALSLILAIITVMLCMSLAFASEEYPVKRENLLVRDPYILVYDGKYYMYGTCL